MIELEHNSSLDEYVDRRSGQSWRSCKQLDDALGWSHRLPATMGVECNALDKAPTIDGDDVLSRTYRRMLLHPLRAPIDDERVESTLKTSREKTIEKALLLGLPRDEILEALLAGIKSGVPRMRALELADRFKLFDDQQ